MTTVDRIAIAVLFLLTQMLCFTIGSSIEKKIDLVLDRSLEQLDLLEKIENNLPRNAEKHLPPKEPRPLKREDGDENDI